MNKWIISVEVTCEHIISAEIMAKTEPVPVISWKRYLYTAEQIIGPGTAWELGKSVEKELFGGLL